MKYMLLFWVDESAEATADEDAAMMIAVKSWVEGMTERAVSLSGGALRSARIRGQDEGSSRLHEPRLSGGSCFPRSG